MASSTEQHKICCQRMPSLLPTLPAACGVPGFLFRGLVPSAKYTPGKASIVLSIIRLTLFPALDFDAHMVAEE